MFKRSSVFKIVTMGILWLVMSYTSVPVFAASSAITVQNIQYNSTNNGTFTITGTNLPTLTTDEAGYGGGENYLNIALANLVKNYVGTPWVGNATYGINVTTATSSEIIFNLATSSTNLGSSPYTIYIAPSGQSVTSSNGGLISSFQQGGINTVTGQFAGNVTESPVLQINTTSPTSVSLNWGSVPYATSYDIYENGNSTAAESGITGTSATITGLTTGETYNFQVAGTNYLSTGPLSPPLSVNSSALAAPEVTVNATSNGNLNVSWAAVADAASYEIDVNGQPFVSNVKQTYLTLSDLPLGSQQSIVVYASDINGDISQPSAPQTATPELAGPQLSISKLTTKSITLNWSPVAGATSYHVYEGDPTLVATTSGTSTTVSGLTAGQPYSFTVQAVTPNGNSLTSAPVAITAPIAIWGFSGVDVLTNALLIVASLGSLLLLALAIEFVPRLWGLLPLNKSPQVTESEEYKQEWDRTPSSSRSDITPVKFDDERW